MVTRIVLIGFLFLFLSGCTIQTRVADEEGAIQVANKENAVHVEKDAVGHVDQGAFKVESNAVHFEKDAVHVEKDAMHVEKDAFGHVEAGAVKVEPGAVSITGTMQSGAVQLPMTVQDGAFQMPVTANVSEGAVKVGFELKVEPGAIVIKGAEAGAIQTKFETPWWAWVIMSLLGIGWLITKFRKQTARTMANGGGLREIPKAAETFWDIFF